jgi:ankyrin repeat protein
MKKEFISAVRSLNFEQIKILIERDKIYVNAPWIASHDYSLKSQTILHILAKILPLYVNDEDQQKIIALFTFLKSKGLDVNVQTTDYKKESALHILAKKFSKEQTQGHSVIQIFMQQGAATDSLDQHSKTPLSYLFNDFLNSLDNFGNRGGLILNYQGLTFKSEDQPERLAERYELLNRAISFNRLDLAYYLLSKGVDPNFQQETGKNLLPLMLADSAQAFELLFQFGADINLQGGYDFERRYLRNGPLFSEITAAHFMIINYSYRKQQQLLDELDNPPLTETEEKVIEKLQILFHHKADFNIQDVLGKTPLHYAVEFSLLKIVDWLIDHGVKLDITDQARNMPLDLSLFHPQFNAVAKMLLLSHKEDVLPLLMKGLPISKKFYKGLFAWPGNTDKPGLKQYLIEILKLEITDSEFFEAVQHEVLVNHSETVRYLLSLPRNINKTELLLFANSPEMMTFLLDCGADFQATVAIEYPDNKLVTGSICHYYVRPSKNYGLIDQPALIKKLEILQARGFNFNIGDSQGKTPLRCAIDNHIIHFIVIAIWLVENSIRLNTVNQQISSDLDAFIERSLSFKVNISCVIALLKQGYIPKKDILDRLLIHATQLENTDVLEYLLLSSTIEFDAATKFEAIKASLITNRDDCLRFLLKVTIDSVNLDYQGENSREPTLLMYAKTADSLKLLLNAWTNPALLADYHGQNYPYNMSSPENGGLQIHLTHMLFIIRDGSLAKPVEVELIQKFEILKQFGVDLNVVDGLDRTPFYYAISTYRYKLAKWLVDQGVNVHLVSLQEKGILAHIVASGLNTETLALAMDLLQKGVKGSQEEYNEIIEQLILEKNFDAVDYLSKNCNIRCPKKVLEKIFTILINYITELQEILLKLIDLGFNINEISIEIRSACLRSMISHFKTDSVQLLIQQGIGIKEIEQFSGFLFAGFFNHSFEQYDAIVTMIDLLLSHGANLNLKTKVYQPSRTQKYYFGEVVTLTEQHCFDMIYNRIDSYDAKKEGQLVDLLLEKGANVLYCEDITQEKMVVDAVRYKKLERVITILSQLPDPNRKSILLQQIFLAAICHDNDKIANYCLAQQDENLQSILDINAFINPKHIEFQSIRIDGHIRFLTLALFLNSSKVVELLIRRGVEVNYEIEKSSYYAPHHQSTPLHQMVCHDLSAIIELTLQINPMLNINDFISKNNEGKEYSLLQLACQSYTPNLEQTVNMLLRYGSDIYETVLHDVCARGYASAVSLLLSKTLDINKRNDHNMTALGCLFEYRYPVPKEKIAEIANILLTAGAELTIEMINKAVQGNYSAVFLQVLLKYIDLPATLNEQHPLLTSMCYDRKDLFDILLNHCRDYFLSIQCYGGSLLHQAFQMRNAYYSEKLLEAGADPTMQDVNGYNVLHVLALENNWEKFLEIATLHPHLLCQANNEGEQPWNLALFAEKMELLESFTVPTIDKLLYGAIFEHLITAYKEVKFIEDLREDNFFSDKPVVMVDSEVHEIKRFSYRLMNLFETIDMVKAYLERHLQQSLSSRFFQKLHDICLFNLPVSGSWSKTHWGRLAVNWGEDVTKYLHAAVRIEALLRHLPIRWEEIQRVASFISYHRETENSQLAQLFKRYNITERGFDVALQYVDCLKEKDNLPDIKIEGALINLSKRYYFTKLPPNDLRGFYLGSLTACCQSIGHYGHSCALHGMTSEDSGFYILFERPSDPEYTKKLLALLDIAKVAVEPVETFLSSITNSEIQKKYQTKVEEIEWSILQKYRLNLTSIEILELLKEEITMDLEDKIVAQCWGWRNAEGHLVLDSWESKHRKYDKFCEPFLAKAAEEILLKDPSIVSVSLGGGGHTPSTLAFPRQEELYSPSDYNGYRDSKDWQYLIDTQEALKQRSLLKQASFSLSHNPQALFSKPSSPIPDIEVLDDEYQLGPGIL